MRSLRTLVAASLLTLAMAAPAGAQIMNGDFEAGPADWTVLLPPPGWSTGFPAAGGNPNGYARIQSPFGNSGGNAHINQTFLCGDPGIPGNCIITLDYRLDQIDASDFTGRIWVQIDGVIQYTSPPGPSAGWVNVTVTVPCGQHVITLNLDVDAGNNGWAACFDNVQARCEPIVPTAPSTWGRIKSLIVE